MITLLAPAKNMNFDPSEINRYSVPRMLDDTVVLADIMKKKSKKDLRELMSISENLASLNKQRFADFSESHNSENAKQAVLTFNGEVYWGLDANSLSVEDLNWSQEHLRILSGLYGILRPLDLIQPYRLEMGTRLKTRKGKDLYKWWGDKLTDRLNKDLAETESGVVMNLASKEYFNALDEKRINADVYSANFLELRKGKYQFVSFTAKRARGWLARFIIENRIKDPQQTKAFNTERFEYLEDLSTDREFVFVREG